MKKDQKRVGIYREMDLKPNMCECVCHTLWGCGDEGMTTQFMSGDKELGLVWSYVANNSINLGIN